MKQVFQFTIVWKLLVFFLAIIATFIIPLNLKFTSHNDYGAMPYFGWIWANFDGYHYITISKYGYGLHQNPFMPLYPIAIHIVSTISRINHLWTALLISNICFLCSLFVVRKCLHIDGFEKISQYVFLSIVLFPTTHYYGAAYNDSLFFFLATLTILFSRKKQWFYASLAGSLATLARLNGLALFPYLFTEYIMRDIDIHQQWNIRNIVLIIKNIINAVISRTFIHKHMLRYISFLCIPAAFCLYLLYTHITFGDWNLVFSSMKVWQQDKITFPLQVVYRYIKILATFPINQFEYWVAFFELSSVFGYTYLLAFAWKKIRVSYWMFFFLSILIPSLTGSFQGMPRYGLHIYPMFLVIGMLIRTMSLRIRMLFLILAILMILFFVGYFTRGYFVA